MPRQVSFPAGTGAIVDVGAGDDYVLAVDGSGAVFGWGQGMHFSHVLCTVASHIKSTRALTYDLAVAWGEAANGLLGNGCCIGEGCTPCTGGESQSGGYVYYEPVAAAELRAPKLGSPVRRIFAGRC